MIAESGNSSRHGEGLVCLEVTNSRELSKGHKHKRAEVVSLKHSYPLHLLVPEWASSSSCRWIFPVTFGGGLVGGDIINIEYNIGPQCSALVTSQESTKVYLCDEGEMTSEHFLYRVGSEAFLAVLGDPVVCFANADFKQTQRAYLTGSSSLVLLDWMTAGRAALGELWQFRGYHSRIEVYVEGELVFKENQHLHDTPNLALKDAMKGFQVLGTCILMGEDLQTVAAQLKRLYARPYTIGEKLPGEVICSYSPIEVKAGEASMQGCYLRFQTATTCQAYNIVKEITGLLSGQLGGDPYAKKY